MYILNNNNSFTLHQNQESIDDYLEENLAITFSTYKDMYDDATTNDWYNALGVMVNECETITPVEKPMLKRYLPSLVLLNQFDSNSIPLKPLLIQNDVIDLATTVLLIQEAKAKLIKLGEASALFGQDKDGRLSGILQNVYQTFGGEYLYATINQRAAFLFYSIVKNHPFSDGNKRIGALLFLHFLEENQIDKNDGIAKFNHNGIVALTILIAQSNANDKDLILNLISNMIG